MAAETSDNTSTKPKVTPAGRHLRKWLFRLAILALLGAAGAFGWREYRGIRQRRMIERARALIEIKDYKQAAISAQRALALNPRDMAANRTML